MIRDAGLRVTAPRQAVLEVLAQTPEDSAGDSVAVSHPDVETITGAARRRLGSVSQQAVYDVLAAFVTAGLVRRVPTDGGAARYEVDRHDNHHHLVCRGCASVIDVPCSTGTAPCLVPGDAHGFAIDQTSVVFWGLCPACRSAAASDTTATTDIRDAVGPGGRV